MDINHDQETPLFELRRPKLVRQLMVTVVSIPTFLILYIPIILSRMGYSVPNVIRTIFILIAIVVFFVLGYQIIIRSNHSYCVYENKIVESRMGKEICYATSDISDVSKLASGTIKVTVSSGNQGFTVEKSLVGYELFLEYLEKHNISIL